MTDDRGQTTDDGSGEARIVIRYELLVISKGVKRAGRLAMEDTRKYDKMSQ
jgi:hypothetical protein